MQLGIIGLGRMGANMARRLIRNGHKCVVYDRTPDEAVPVPVLASALFERFESRGEAGFVDKHRIEARAQFLALERCPFYIKTTLKRHGGLSIPC